MKIGVLINLPHLEYNPKLGYNRGTNLPENGGFCVIMYMYTLAVYNKVKSSVLFLT